MALIACPECTAQVSDHAPACPHCGYPFTGIRHAGLPAVVETDPRQPIFEERITEFVLRGYRVVSRTETTAQLVRPKVFSFFWATAWFLVCGVGVLVYLFWYASKRDEVLYLSIEDPYIQRLFAMRMGHTSPAWTCARCGAGGSPHAFDCARCGASRPTGRNR